jgi:ribosomal protein S18 acetylase RimI-like enzyme
MESEPAFDIGLAGYSIHRLGLEDVAALQGLFEKCADYMLLVDGRLAGPNSAESELQSRPPGKPLEDKFLFGIVNPHNDLVGELDVMRAYPDDSTWWIGLLLMEPSARSLGLGEKVVEGFADYVQANGGQAIMLGVVAKNENAYRFWSRRGFELVQEREPQAFGEKTHIVRVMRRSLIEQAEG